jgi:hypothetical protein
MGLGWAMVTGGCKDKATDNPDDPPVVAQRSPRLALWLAKKSELIAQPEAVFDLVMSGWFEPSEATAIRSRKATSKTLAGLSHTWTLDDAGWLALLVTVANGGDAGGPLQITDDMYLMLDDDANGTLDRRCSPPGWDDIYAMDPRHTGWRELILAFYATVAAQSQHDGIIVDMVDAHPFCEGGWSGGVATALDSADWVVSQAELLGLIAGQVPAGKWTIANAGRDFPVGSPFPQHVNGYLLENFLGSWGVDLAGGLASAERALTTTKAPHIVVFATDTDDTGVIDWPRFRTGLAASLLMDNTYFAFDYGSRDHGGVTNYWFPDYYTIALGPATSSCSLTGGVYRRDFQRGAVIVAVGDDAPVTFGESHRDVASGVTGTAFTVPQGDAGFFLRVTNP